MPVMFWSKKDKKTDKHARPASAKAGPKASDRGVGTQKSQRSGGAGVAKSSADIRAEALANARAARERLGDETIQKIADALVKKQMSLTEQAKARIARENSDRVADEIRLLLDDKST